MVIFASVATTSGTQVVVFRSNVVYRVREDPTGLDPTRQHLPNVFAHLRVEQLVELGVHGFEQRAVLLPIEREIVQLERILLEIEQLDVVRLEQRLERARLVVLLWRVVAREL